MTGRTPDSNGQPSKVVQAAIDATFDIGDLGEQLTRVTTTLDALQRDNQLLSDAVTETQELLEKAQISERKAQETADAGKREIGRLQAAVDRRDAELVKVEDELTKMRSERTDWESVVLAERDAAIEEQTADLATARAEMRALNDRIAHLEDELSLERQRTAPDTHLVQLMTTAGTTLLIDGEDLVRTGWPELAPERRRGQVIEAASRFHQRHGVNTEVILASAEGWDPDEPAPAGVRIRVPHEGIAISACLSRLARAYGSGAPLVTVSSSAAEEPWISTARAASLMGLPVSQHSHHNQDLESAMEEEK